MNIIIILAVNAARWRKSTITKLFFFLFLCLWKRRILQTTTGQTWKRLVLRVLTTDLFIPTSSSALSLNPSKVQHTRITHSYLHLNKPLCRCTSAALPSEPWLFCSETIDDGLKVELTPPGKWCVPVYTVAQCHTWEPFASPTWGLCSS